ncbi:glycosyltransferase [candidate division WWE3 bacterium]|nr:glycosyltransferase [candidate division WWE3 bacterium]
MAKYNVLCLSNQLWDTVSPTNKHHVMRRLAKLGHTVLYVDPPINAGWIFLGQLQRGLWSLKRILTGVKKEYANVFVFSPINPVPLGWFMAKMHARKMGSLTRRLFDKDAKTVLWVYHVQINYIEVYLDELAYDVLIYDCVDNYSAFAPENRFFRINTKDVDRQEELLTKSADLVFAVTPLLIEKLRKYRADVHWIPNAGDFELFKDAKKYKYQLPKDLEVLPRPRIGYVGALDEYKFDGGLVRRLASDHQNYSFVLIGPIALKDKSASLKGLGLDGLSNVHYLGPRPYERKKYYLAGFDAEIIPFQLNDYTINSYPVKFHDSLSAGLPVVTTNLPAFALFKDVAYISKNYDEFSQNLVRALEEDSPRRMRERQEVAKKYSWDNKVAVMSNLISDKLKEKTSV